MQYWLSAQGAMPRLPQSVWVGAGGWVDVGVRLGHFLEICQWVL